MPVRVRPGAVNWLRRLDRGRGDPGSSWIVFEPKPCLGGDIVVPDLAGRMRESLPKRPDATFCAIAPDTTCEAPAPWTRRIHQDGKRTDRDREDVSRPWFVDPAARMLEGFALRDGQWTLLAVLPVDTRLALPPFDAFGSLHDAFCPECAAAGGDGTGHGVAKVAASIGNSSMRVAQTMRRL